MVNAKKEIEIFILSRIVHIVPFEFRFRECFDAINASVISPFTSDCIFKTFAMESPDAFCYDDEDDECVYVFDDDEDDEFGL